MAEGFENEVFKKGEISIFDSQTNQELFAIESDEFAFELDNENRVKTNILELPYGEQSILISDDFNFDGKKDLAIMDGQNSCYHLPSYQVYLETPEGLRQSPEFTRLAQEYCGMFQVDPETQTLYTQTKSGCCWHQFSQFKVVGGIPAPIAVVEAESDFAYYTETRTIWEGDEKQVTIEKWIDLDQEGINEVLSFTLRESRRRVVVFNINDRNLNYAMINPDGLVEFAYPVEMVYQNPDFQIDEQAQELTFGNGDTNYRIYEIKSRNRIRKVGLQIETVGKKDDLRADLSSVKGSLRNVQIVKLDNVVYEN